MNIYLISDTHFGHGSMLQFKKDDGTHVRSFASVEEMDEHMIDRWNAVVRPQDHVYHLGDVVMRRDHLKIISRLNGHKRLVRGNHDIFKTADYLKYFEEIHGTRFLAGLLLTHIPIHPISMARCEGNVHGHLHNHLPQFGVGDKYFNVSVELINYTPIALEDVKAQIRKNYYG